MKKRKRASYDRVFGPPRKEIGRVGKKIERRIRGRSFIRPEIVQLLHNDWLRLRIRPPSLRPVQPRELRFGPSLAFSCFLAAAAEVFNKLLLLPDAAGPFLARDLVVITFTMEFKNP
jgi:hypothetical protein